MLIYIERKKMKLSNYTLEIGGKSLLNETDVLFRKGEINYILGENGIGKSVFAKSLFHKYENITLIGSYTNIPNDVTFESLLVFLRRKFSYEKIMELYHMLGLNKIDHKVKISKLSDGQKQKIKLLVFFLFEKEIIILDEISNALDRKSVNEIYSFLTQFLLNNKTNTIISITHNPLDVKLAKGSYFIFKNKTIREIDSIENLMAEYMEE